MVNDRPQFILAGNGSYENRGCEAIVRGTLKILRAYYDNPRVICISRFESDEQYTKQCQHETDDAILHLATRKLDKKELMKNFWKPKILDGGFKYFFKRDAFYSWSFGDMLPYLNEAKAVLSIGGDNYSLDYGVPRAFTALDDLVRTRGKPIIIFGASIGPFYAMPDYERFMGAHLRKVTGIFAREMATIGYLRNIGVTENVYPVADPAFLMDPVKPDGIDAEIPIEKGAIGINLSPLISNYMADGKLDIWTKIAAQNIETISRKTEMPLYLIPHVTNLDSDDYQFMKRALSLIPGMNDNIKIVPPIYNAAELKWIISRMSLFIGARTHSTIAALSSGVPTLSIAYSIKSQGINKELFGHTNYCISPKDLTPENVSAQILKILDREGDIRKELSDRIPLIQRSALNAGMKLHQITEMN